MPPHLAILLCMRTHRCSSGTHVAGLLPHHHPLDDDVEGGGMSPQQQRHGRSPSTAGTRQMVWIAPLVAVVAARLPALVGIVAPDRWSLGEGVPPCTQAPCRKDAVGGHPAPLHHAQS